MRLVTPPRTDAPERESSWPPPTTPRGRGARLARLEILSQSVMWPDARHRTHAARSVPHPPASPRPRGDRRVLLRRPCLTIHTVRGGVVLEGLGAGRAGGQNHFAISWSVLTVSVVVPRAKAHLDTVVASYCARSRLGNPFCLERPVRRRRRRRRD